MESIPNLKVQGKAYGRRLTHVEAKKLLVQPQKSSARGRRDYAILAVFLGCGLRRAEVASLTWDHLSLEDGTWIIRDLVGKGKRKRTVPVPVWVKAALDATVQDNDSAHIFRSIDRHGVWGNVLTPFGVWYIVREYAKLAGFENLAPHDLRRTYAKLARKNGAELDQLQQVLGHSNVATTQRYVDADLDMAAAAQFVMLGD